MSGTRPLLESIEIKLSNCDRSDFLTVYVDVYDNSLSLKWLTVLTHLVQNNYHLEKNYCFFGFVDSDRNAEYICNQINCSIQAINLANIGYTIDDYFSVDNTIHKGPVGPGLPGRKIIHEKFNQLHRYFEDLQGISGAMSPYYDRADAATRWHIRQLNLLCHEFESWVLSYRKSQMAPEWQRPSQLMCWLHAPRFVLEPTDFELFGVETIARPLGGVFVGVNKAVGKHHWEVFQDEGRDSRIDELTTTTLRSQTEATGDFDIEWANNPGEHQWMKDHLEDFKQWLKSNGFDPNDATLTIGHPQVGQVDLIRSFGTTDYQQIWPKLAHYLDVYKITIGKVETTYEYNWSDNDYVDRQIKIIQQGY
jgi:hypothetical protein